MSFPSSGCPTLLSYNRRARVPCHRAHRSAAIYTAISNTLRGFLAVRVLTKYLLCAVFALSLAVSSLQGRPPPPPSVSTSSGSASFVAGDNVASTPVVADPGVTVSNPVSFAITSGTVSITGNFQSGEDVLAFTNTNSTTFGNIGASYNSGSGVLSLTGSGDSTAQWQAALRAVTYTDTAITPNNATRTVGFNLTVSSISFTTSTATRNVTVTDTNQTPILTTTGGTTLNYLGGAAAIDSGVHVSDLDNTTQASGTVSITSGFISGDTLAFTNTNSTTYGNISASYDSGTGILTLTSSSATATDAQWAAAFSAVTFSSTTAGAGNRTISFVVSDGTKSSTAATDTVSITGPIVTTDAGSAAFVAGDNVTSSPVAVDAGVTITDGSNSTLQSATVSITGNFQSGEDVLAFTNTDSTTYGNIAALYDASTGVLTLTSSGNTATLTQWQAALATVTYTDTAVTPNNATRTISFSVTDANSNASNTATRTVTVADTDQTPIVTTTGGTTLNYLGGAVAAVIDSGITVSDLDNTTQSSGTVSITSGFASGDTLAFTNTNSATYGNISASYDSGTGILALTSSGASATDAQWANAFSAVKFSSSSTSYGNRTISFVVNDGTENSTAATDIVDVLNPDPVVTPSGGSATFVSGDNTVSTPVVIDSGLTVTDPASSTLVSGTVSITGNFHSGEDVLAFTNNGTTMGDIASSYNATAGVLTLTSSTHATLAQWQAALRAITYTDTAVTPNNATRTISFTVNDGTNSSTAATRTVTVIATDQTPIVTTTSGVTNYVAGSNAATIDSGVTVTDLDNATQSSATVSITAGFHGGDTLAFTNTSASTYGNISASYSGGAGVLTLTSSGATATDAQWASAFSAVTFSAGSSATAGTRTISFVVNDGADSSAASIKKVNVASVSVSYPAPLPDGYAASATGGTGTGSVSVTVLTAANFITQAQSATTSVITVAGVIDLGSTPVNVKSNKTIQGADANSALIGNLNLASGMSNVIIRGLNLTNPGTAIVSGAYTDGGDAITIAGASNVFITHCTFFDTANHAIQITNSADNITVSWSEFYYTAGQTVHRFSLLIGAPGAETVPLHVSLHHNFWSTLVDQRMPIATFGYVHLYSNYFNATGNTSGTVSSDQAQLLSERNVYTGMASPLTRQNVNVSLPIGRILPLGNTYTTVTGTAPYSGLDQVFTPTYSYEALPATDVALVVSTNAGNIAGAGYTDAAVGSAAITGPSTAVTPGTSFTLTAVPASFTPSSYQWRLGNLDIAGATSSTYTVSNTQAANAGLYTVAIGLVSGDVVVSTPFTVTLGASPNNPPPNNAPGIPGSSGAGGGGAMSEWFLGALAMLHALRRSRQRRNI